MENKLRYEMGKGASVYSDEYRKILDKSKGSREKLSRELGTISDYPTQTTKVPKVIAMNSLLNNAI